MSDWLRRSKKIILVVVLVLLLVPAVILVGIRQRSPKASNSISIQVNPGIVDQSSSPQIGKPVYLSATAVNDIGQPITSGVTYSWGISSTFPISPTFKPNDNLASFTPNSTGSGTLWVSAVTSESSAIKYIDICVGVPCSSYSTPTPKPTCQPRPACLDNKPACKLSEPAEGWCLPLSSPTPTPTSTSVPTPTPRPSPTPTSTPIPSPTPTPTPTPISNNPPTIVTQILPAGFMGRKYATSVTATDANPNDYLNAEVVGLPPLLTLSSCTQFSSTVHTIVCTISGTPNRFGTFPIKITVTDSAGAAVSKIINLPIFKKYILF